MTARDATALRDYAAQRSRQCRADIEQAIKQLHRAGAPININSVAKRAGVSRRTIYRHEDLAAKIANLRDATSTTLRAVATTDATPTEGTTNSIINALRTELRRQQTTHRDETARLNAALAERDQALAAAHGEIQRLRLAVETPKSR